jgi:hypothetical protein
MCVVLLNLVVHHYNPSTWKSEADAHEFEVSLDYVDSSRPAWDLRWEPVSKKKKKYRIYIYFVYNMKKVHIVFTINQKYWNNCCVVMN